MALDQSNGPGAADDRVPRKWYQAHPRYLILASLPFAFAMVLALLMCIAPNVERFKAAAGRLHLLALLVVVAYAASAILLWRLLPRTNCQWAVWSLWSLITAVALITTFVVVAVAWDIRHAATGKWPRLGGVPHVAGEEDAELTEGVPNASSPVGPDASEP